MTRVFVYGSLLVGEQNHYLLEGAAFLGAASTEPSYTLVNLGSFPAMIPGGASRVVGEIFEVNEETLIALDNLEGHPTWYHRIDVTLADGRAAETYVMEASKVEGLPVIPSGSWRDRPY